MTRLRLSGAACALCLSLCVFSNANAYITYHVERTIGDGTVTGFIETDGTLGLLGSDNITNWMFTLFAPDLFGGPTDEIDFATATQTTIAGLAVTATATELLFDFTEGSGNYLIFQGSSPENYWCLETTGCSGNGPGEVIGNIRSGLGSGCCAASVPRSGSAVVFAEVAPVPLPTAAWLFVYGLLGLVGLARRKKA